MSVPVQPTLEQVAERNPRVTPKRVREMQEVVKRLQDCGVLRPSKYGIQPALGGHQSGFAAAQGLETMNRTGTNG